METYLHEAALSADSDTASKCSLHVIVDKAGRVPAQLVDHVEKAKALGIPVTNHTSEQDNWPLGEESDVNHQRICLKVPTFQTHDLGSALAAIRDATAANFKGCVGAVLDQIHDPRNFGSVLRSAAFFDLKFVIYGKDRQAELSPLVVKASAGGAFALKLIPVVNISRALKELKEAGAWVTGTSLGSSTPLKDVAVDRTYVVVLGNEAKGLRPEVAKQCDIEMIVPGGQSTVDSLNVSVCAGIVFSHFSSAQETLRSPESASDDAVLTETATPDDT